MQAAETISAANDSGDQVDRLREILFGSQLREQGQRLAEIEQRLRQADERQRAELEQRLRQLESFVRADLEQLATQLRDERRERAVAIERIEQTLASQQRMLDERLSELADRLHDESHDVREQVHEQGKRLAAELRQRHDEVQDRIDQEAGQLRGEKTGRDELAGLFSELALRLNRQFDLPGGGE